MKIKVTEEEAAFAEEYYKFMDCPYASDFGNVWDNVDTQRQAMVEKLKKIANS